VLTVTQVLTARLKDCLHQLGFVTEVTSVLVRAQLQHRLTLRLVVFAPKVSIVQLAQPSQEIVLQDHIVEQHNYHWSQVNVLLVTIVRSRLQSRCLQT
jgi:hypothetical protein